MTTKYTDEIIDELLERISSAESLNQICNDPRMPSRRTVYGWIENPDKADFKRAYEVAQRERANLLADQIIEIADSTEDPQKARVQVDARKWIAARIHNRQWGDKKTIEGGETPIKIASISADLSPEEAARLYQDMIGG